MFGHAPVVFDPNMQPGGDVFVAQITQVGATITDTNNATWVPHGWQEMRHNPYGLGYLKNELGRRSDVLSNPMAMADPAFTLDGSAITQADGGASTGSLANGPLVFIRLRGRTGFPPASPPPQPGTPSIYNCIYDIITTLTCSGFTTMRVVTDLCPPSS